MSQSHLEDQPLLINDSNKALAYQRATNSRAQTNTSTPSYCKVLKFFFISIISLLFLFVIINLILFSLYLNDQIHLSYTNSNTNNITATWITFNDYYHSNSYLEYTNLNDKSSSIRVIPEVTQIEGDILDRYVYRVNLTGLEFNTSYQYHIINSDKLDGPFIYDVPEKSTTDYKGLFFADVGLFFSDMRNIIIDFASTENIDFMFHLGDISYNINSFFGFFGDIFLSLMQPIAAEIPYLTTPGNRENYNNFSSYMSRFSMPNYKTNKNLYYTTEKPPLKIISFNTEAYYFDSMNASKESQYNFVLNELNNTNRTQFPWLVIAGHHPMYLAYREHDWEDNPIRISYEELFNQYNVTLFISTNKNYYQRLCPIYNGTCQQNTTGESIFYLNKLQYPITISAGGGNNDNDNDVSNNINLDWKPTLFLGENYGMLHVNYTYLSWKAYSFDSEKNLFKIDSILINNY